MDKMKIIMLICFMLLPMSCVKTTVADSEENEVTEINKLSLIQEQDIEKLDVNESLADIRNKIEEKNPSEAFLILKKNIALAAEKQEGYDVNLNNLCEMLDVFLSHVSVEFGNGGKHNIVPRLISKYDGILLDDNLIVFEPTDENKEETRISKNTFEFYLNKDVEKELDCIIKKHTYKIENTLKKNLMYVKKTNLYYVAIATKDIPDFVYSSDNEVLNFAACIKAIIQSAGIDVSYNEIIGKLIDSPVEDNKIKTDKNYTGILSDRKIDVAFISMDKYSLESVVSRELLDGNFLVSVNKGENTGLVTFAALKKTSEKEYEPVSIKMRIPNLPKDKQRKEMSWKEFKENNLAIAVVNIY